MVVCALQELCAEVEEISADPHGSRVLLYLLSPRSPRHFKRSFCALLEGGDGNKYRWAGQGRVGWACVLVSVSVGGGSCGDDQS